MFKIRGSRWQVFMPCCKDNVQSFKRCHIEVGVSISYLNMCFCSLACNRKFKSLYDFQMEFLRHLFRRRGLELLSVTGKVEGKRDRGKQRITFLDSLCKSATGGQSKGLNFFKLSDDRDVWRGMAANVCSRSGT